MKIILKTLRDLFFAMLVAIACFSCGSKGDPSPTDKNKALLTNGTWSVVSVKVDGVDHTNLFTGLTLKFDASKILSSGENPVWPASQTWKFSDASGMKIKREDGIDMTITEINAKVLKFSLQWQHTIIDSGRAKSVSGKHEFQFSK